MRKDIYIAIPDKKHLMPTIVTLSLSPTVEPQLPGYTFKGVYPSRRAAEKELARIKVLRTSNRLRRLLLPEA